MLGSCNYSRLTTRLMHCKHQDSFDHKSLVNLLLKLTESVTRMTRESSYIDVNLEFKLCT